MRESLLNPGWRRNRAEENSGAEKDHSGISCGDIGRDVVNDIPDCEIFRVWDPESVQPDLCGNSIGMGVSHSEAYRGSAGKAVSFACRGLHDRNLRSQRMPLVLF